MGEGVCRPSGDERKGRRRVLGAVAGEEKVGCYDGSDGRGVDVTESEGTETSHVHLGPQTTPD